MSVSSRQCNFFLSKIRVNPRLTPFVATLLLVAVSFASVAQGEDTQFRQIAPGIEHLQVIRGTGPWRMHMLRLDLKKVRLKFVRAMDEAVGLETTSSLAARHGALAAINGGFFRTTGVYRGESTGVFLWDGNLISETYNDRAAVGLIDRAGEQNVLLGHMNITGEILSGRDSHKIAGVNRPVERDELVLFTPKFHSTTLTSPTCVEVIVQKTGRVKSISDMKGSSRIPKDGYVISASGSARDWIKQRLRVGRSLTISWHWRSIEPGQIELWRSSTNILGGGPQIIRDGKISITNEQEKFAPAFVTDRHPRTAIAKLNSGQVLLVTVDGRQPGVSVGMSLTELSNLLLEFGAVEAINLDGGGSTTMVIGGKVVNKPSDQTGERPISDAILIFSRRD